MSTSKYDQYIVKHPVAKSSFGPGLKYTGETDYKSDFTLMVMRITEPTLMEETAHSHDFDMYLYFLSFDPGNMGDLGAEIEIGLGPEQEIFSITSPTSIYIPRGLVHCPLRFKRVDKAVLFIHASISPKYYKSPGPNS
jgi:hypothetical protein